MSQTVTSTSTYVKRLWRTVRVPAELDNRIVALAEKMRWAKWKVVLEAIAMYETFLRKPKAKEELPIIDKTLWYIEKICMSIGALKENPTNENLEKTKKTIQQIKDRLKVDTALLERAVEDYFNTVNTARKTNPVESHETIDEATIEVNMALKSILIEIIYRYILKEEIAKQEKTAETQTSSQ